MISERLENLTQKDMTEEVANELWSIEEEYNGHNGWMEITEEFRKKIEDRLYILHCRRVKAGY